MAHTDFDSTHDPSPASEPLMVPFAALGALTLAAACAAYATRPSPRRDPETQRRESLTAYLHDHLGASSMAIQVVKRLAASHHATDDGALFRRLATEFAEERHTLQSVMAALGASTRSAKRGAAAAAGPVLATASGGSPGSLALFRTVEALAVAVQGKRLLWRALQTFDTIPGPVGRAGFAELEGQALRQWELLERRRQELIASTFA